MFKTMVMFSVFGLLPASQVQTTQVRAGQWRVERMQDRFTGTVTCRAHLGPMHIEGPAMIIRFGQGVQAGAAEYRIDSGPAISAEADAFNVQYHGRIVGVAPIDNPSAGRVAIPISELKLAHAVWIRLAPQASPRRFDVSGLDQAMAAEATLGCP